MWCWLMWKQAGMLENVALPSRLVRDVVPDRRWNGKRRLTWHGNVSRQGRAGESLIVEVGAPFVPWLRLRVGVS